MRLSEFILNCVAFIALIFAIWLNEEYESGFWIFAIYTLFLHFYAYAISERERLREKLSELNETPSP